MPDQRPTLGYTRQSADPALPLFVVAGTLLFSLFYGGIGNALFMRVFYGTGEHAPHLIDSKRGLLSDGNMIPPFLDLLRLATDVVPIFAFAIGFGLFLVWTGRRRN